MAYSGKVIIARSCGTNVFTDQILWGTSDEYYRNFNKYNPYLMFIGPSGNVARLPAPPHGFPFDGEQQGSGPRLCEYHGYQNMYSMSGWFGRADTHLGTNDMVWAGNELHFGNYLGRATYAFCPYNLDEIHQVSGEQINIFMVKNASIGKDGCPSPYRKLVQGGHYKFIKLGSARPDLTAPPKFCHAMTLIADDVYYTLDERYRFYLYNVHTQHIYRSKERMDAEGRTAYNHGSGYIGLAKPIFNGLNPYYNTRPGNYVTNPFNILHSAYDVIEDASYDSIQHQIFYLNGKQYIVNPDRIGYTFPRTSIINTYKDLLRENQKTAYKIDGTYENFDYYVNKNVVAQEKNYFNSQYKCPIIFKDKLLFLQPDGKLLKEDKGQIVEQADISNYLDGTRASGLISGNLGDGQYPATYKCYGARLGNTLHVFLNYHLSGTTLNQNVKGGVIWATSDDLVTFTDRTDALPNSGIIPSSGLDYLTYINRISPYVYSGYNDFEGVTEDNQPGTSVSGSPAVPCRPSGWMQRHSIDSVWESGIFVNNDYSKSPDQWNVPMQYDTQTQFLHPTNIIVPSGYYNKEGSGVVPGDHSYMEPYGVSHSGLAWNGVCPYHIFGYKDETENKLHLFFTEDALYNNYDKDESDSNPLADNPPNQTLYYTLDSGNNWQFMNQFLSKRLSWVEPTDLNEPSVILPSGSPKGKVFPYEDVENGVVFQKFKVYDYPFFRNVDINVQYSTDYGATWHAATPHSTLSDYENLDTGSLSTDPSGTIGKTYMFAWDHSKDNLPKSANPFVKLRIRAKAND